MRLHNILAAILAAALLLEAAADFWAIREPGQWTEQEIKIMVTDSPWAKAASVQMKGAVAPPQVVVRWDSAAPVVEACAKGGLERHLFSCSSKLLYLSGMQNKFDVLAKDYYIIGMSNYPKSTGPWKGEDAPQHSPAAIAALERMGERIQPTTFLKPKGRSPIKPDRIVAIPSGQMLLLMVFFPRSAVLTIDDKEVLFESVSPVVEVRATFDLSKMVYKSNLEL